MEKQTPSNPTAAAVHGRLRCVVESRDDTLLHVTASPDHQPLTIRYATTAGESLGDWSYLRPLLRKGLQLNIIHPHEDDAKVLVPELIILNPDSLISVTAVAGCFHATGASPYWEIVRKIKPRPLTRHTLLGNLAGQFLDEAAYGRDTTYVESIKTFFRKNALDLAACDELDNSFHVEAQRQQAIINRVMQSDIRIDHQTGFPSERMILEPSFFCETLGLQGRMDCIHQDMSTIVEQKSGKGAWGSSEVRPKAQTPHYVQLLLYRAIFHYAYGHRSYEAMNSALFYSKYPEGLLELGSDDALLFEAIKMRNQIAWLELHCAEQGFDFLSTMAPETICPAARGTLWTRYTRPELLQLLSPLQLASPLERAYVLRFMRFVANEHLLSKFGDMTQEQAGLAMLWNCTTEEKRQAGWIYEQLVMEPLADEAEQVEVDFRFTIETDADTTNFRLGDIIIFYPYQPDSEPDGTSAIVFRATLTDIRREGISVRLRNPQNTRVFSYYKDCHWAVEHDFMEASYDAQYRGVYSFLSATGSRRQLLMGQRKPSVLPLSESKEDASEFEQLVQRVASAQDLYLILGPPGTGKTSFGMLNVLKEQLAHPGTSILLMAYTNRAVDEMCLKLIKENIDFIRLGSASSCSAECRDHLMDRRMTIYNKVDDIRECIRRTRVFCGTTTAFNSRSQLFHFKAFDLAIVDEASQLLEPDLIGLMSARHGDGDAIRKFVLIGDEKQLPAVVQQPVETSRVTEPELQAIGLTDCRLSLFERLLRQHKDMGEQFFHLLTRQGRMHTDIQAFPSQAFYEGRLRPVPLPHQQESTDGQRILFITYDQPSPHDGSDKANRREAEIIASVVSRACAESNEPEPSIGIIVPYRNQISTVRSALLAAGIHAAVVQSITIDTVERYQGSERDLIIYGFTVKQPYQLSFLTNNDYVDDQGNTIDRKLNVAMTRARKHLVMVGCAPLLSQDPVFRRLINYCREHHCLVSDVTLARPSTTQ